MLDEEEIKRLVAAFRAELDSRRAVDERTHHAHHEFIAMRIVDMQEARERREKIKAQVGGWAIIATLTGMAAAVWEWAKRHVGMP